MAKNFSTYRQICRNFRKIQFFAEKCHLFDYEMRKWGSLSDKDVSGSFGDKEFVKKIGVIGWKLVKMGVFRWKRAKQKVGVFFFFFWWHMARNPKLSAPRGMTLKNITTEYHYTNLLSNVGKQ